MGYDTKPRIDQDTDYYQIYVPYNEDFNEDIKAEFRGRWNPELKCWTVVRGDYPYDALAKLVKLHHPTFRPQF